ncbi:hypothetical protein BVY00_02465 [bacterium G20]|nr:hypothetical protein BVY00_02465 [bacterium G20]
MRYGDDWLCFSQTQTEASASQHIGSAFLESISLAVNPELDQVQAVKKGIKYLGVEIWPNGRRLQKSIRRRILKQLGLPNQGSYRTLVKSHENPKYIKLLDWQVLELDNF